MAIVSILLDPAAVVYTDDEIVGKINAAAVNISRADAVESAAVDLSGKSLDDLVDSATRLAMSDAEDTKLEGIAEGAEVNPADLDGVPDSGTRFAAVEADAKGDQDGGEIRDLVVALADADRKIVITAPTTGEHKVASVEVDADLKLKADYDDTPES